MPKKELDPLSKTSKEIDVVRKEVGSLYLNTIIFLNFKVNNKVKFCILCRFSPLIYIQCFHFLISINLVLVIDGELNVITSWMSDLHVCLFLFHIYI